MSGKIEISVGDMSDVEGHVYARYLGEDAQHNRSEVGDAKVALCGTLRGPFCESARTLPAQVEFRDLGPNEAGVAKAIVPDPCIWTSELPHLYQVDVQARQGDQILAEYHGKIGLRRK
jgi:hypothetical protein